VLLQNSAAAIPDRQIDEIHPSFSDFDGLARAISVSSQNVSRALKDASESRLELEAMIDSMQDAVVAVDPAGRIQWTNQRMQKLIPGASFSSAIRIGHALVQTIRDPEVLACVRTALEQRVVSDGRSTSLLPGRIFEVNASPMPGGGAVAVLHDITRIEEVERTQRDFVANVSHELRTPLTSITGYVETLLDHEASLSQPAREFLTIILKNASRMNRLTEDLLVMARVESSEQELHPAPIPADILVRDAVQAMSGLVQDTESILEIGDISTAEVVADTDAILQVLSNLIENGIKYGQARNEPVCRVVITSREVSEPIEAVEFSVRDFGPGIASEHLARIFERFYRVDKARSRESGGTGLGLAIARHMVQTHGGSIRAESELNAGSNFIFTLPKAQNSLE
jgi:two-component system, OmpR family, phosphate regulon sensor histidine kinase PhoR